MSETCKYEQRIITAVAWCVTHNRSSEACAVAAAERRAEEAEDRLRIVRDFVDVATNAEIIPQLKHDEDEFTAQLSSAKETHDRLLIDLDAILDKVGGASQCTCDPQCGSVLCRTAALAVSYANAQIELSSAKEEVERLKGQLSESHENHQSAAETCVQLGDELASEKLARLKDSGYAWMIERKADVENESSTPLWWDGYTKFTPDPNGGVRFARKQDAERIIETHGLMYARATDHVWVSAASSPEGKVEG